MPNTTPDFPLPPVDVRTNVLNLWASAPGVMLFLRANDRQAYDEVVQQGGFILIGDVGRFERASATIASDRVAMPAAPAQGWEATQVQNGVHRPIGIYDYRVRTARTGGDSVVGRRIVQVQARDTMSWKSFGFITRSGEFRLWSSFRASAFEPFVTGAARYFSGDGRRALPTERTCWLCNNEVGDGQVAQVAHGLCNDHVRRLPNPQPQQDLNFREIDDGDGGHFLQARRPPRREPVPVVVEASRSELNAEFWQ